MGARTFADEPKGVWNPYLEFLSFALRTAVTRFMMELSRWHWSLRQRKKASQAEEVEGVPGVP